ncbi:MAG: helix-turn-helix domain-containing protein [Lachnospiraceae bacterium]|nr:helix-turn-helix domain-containing protein [Lachnospiraceae bacterium]
MEKVRYMISDAAGMVGVETHVLRYWEEELDLTIPRNEMGHRYYTRDNIAEFQKIKELKEKGYQLKAIRAAIHKNEIPPEPQMLIQPEKEIQAPVNQLSAEERMAQFRELMSSIVGQAIEQNNEELSQTISREIHETVLKEMNYLFREQEDAQEERYKKLDAAIRGKLRGKRSLFAKKEKQKKDKSPKVGDALPTNS